MDFNPLEKTPRPLGGLYKPGAGVMVTMSVPPALARPLLTENIARAETAAYTVVGGPDFDFNPGMIHEYNLLLATPNVIDGNYNPAAYGARLTGLLASIAELVRFAWIELTDYLVDAQGLVLARVADLLDERTPPEYKATAALHLDYYTDELTAIGPQIVQIAALLDVAGQIVEDKIRGFKSAFTRSRLDLMASLKTALRFGADAARAAAESLKTPMKWGTVAVVGLAVVAVAGAFVYFIPRPRGRR